MTHHDLLTKLLQAAHLGEATKRFRPGAHKVTPKELHSPDEVVQALRASVEQDGHTQGWILLADQLAVVNGAWNPDWASDLPLAAELARPDGASSVVLSQSGDGWTISTIVPENGGDGLLEEVVHLGPGKGSTERHEVAWAGGCCLRHQSSRPHSQTIHNDLPAS